jgi:hypothetical protein
LIYIIPEVTFCLFYFAGSFYKKLADFFLFVPYFIVIMIFNYSFFLDRKYYYKYYLLISKLTSIEILIFYSIFIIKGNYDNIEDRVFLLIYIAGAFSGIFSFVYLNICFCRFKKNCQFHFKKLYFLFSETIAILIVHPILIYFNFYLISDVVSISGVIKYLLGMVIFIFELFFFIVNCYYFYKMEGNDTSNIWRKIKIASIKALIFILIEIFLIDLNIPKNVYILSFLRLILLALSLVTFCITN